MIRRIDKELALILLAGALVYFGNLGGTSIYILDEAKNAGCAMEMMSRGDAITPTFNGELRTDKPPLHYYFMMVGYYLFGVTPFGARFFSALAGIMLLLVVYVNVKKWINRSAGFFSTLALVSSAQLAVQFHLAVPDPYLILLLTVALFSFFNGFHGDGRQLKWFYAAIALAFLTKGPIAVILPGLIIIAYVLIIREFNVATFRKMQILSGALIFCVVALPWYIMVGVETQGAWLEGFFIHHNMQRYTDPMEGHKGFFGLPFIILLLGMLPFSLFAIQAIKLGLKEWRERKILLFSMVVCVVFALFFSFSKTLLPSYPAPALPFLAILFGNFLARFVNDPKYFSRGIDRGFISNMMAGTLICVVVWIALMQDAQLSDLRSIAAIFVVLPAGAVVAWLCFRRNRIAISIHVLAGSWILLSLMFFYFANPRLDAINPVRQSLQVFHPDSARHVAGYRRFNPAFVFNLQQPIEVINTPDEINALLAKREKVIVITRAKYLKDLPDDTPLKVIYRTRDLFENNETVLLAN